MNMVNLDKMSENAPDWVVEAAWLGCVHWAAGEKKITSRFERETGKNLKPGSPLEAMIDKVTGYDRRVALEFVRWVTVNLWSEKEAPEAYRRIVADLEMDDAAAKRPESTCS